MATETATVNGWTTAKKPKVNFTARAGNGDWSNLYVQSWKPDRIGATGFSFHNGNLVGMGSWVEFDRETGTEIWPEWRAKLGEQPQDGELLQIDAEFLPLIAKGAEGAPDA